MKLISYPDAKFIAQAPTDTYFTLGKEYTVVREIGNGVVVIANNGDEMIVTKQRFQ